MTDKFPHFKVRLGGKDNSIMENPHKCYYCISKSAFSLHFFTPEMASASHMTCNIRYFTYLFVVNVIYKKICVNNIKFGTSLFVSIAISSHLNCSKTSMPAMYADDTFCQFPGNRQAMSI